MTARSDLFRQEALEFRTRGETSSGGVIRLGAPWLRWCIRLLLVLVAAGVAVAFLVRTYESSSGPAVVDGRRGTFSALLPIAAAPQLRSARGLRLDMPGAGRLRVKVTRARVVGPRTLIDGLRSTGAAIVLRGRVTPADGTARAQARRIRTRATLVLRRERLGQVVLRQFRSMLGQGGGGA